MKVCWINHLIVSYFNTITGKLKFKALREWLENTLPSSSKIPLENAPKKNKKAKSEL